jgi:hypothetical protein
MILTPINASSVDSLLSRLRWNKELIGDKDGVNMVYTTPDYFVQSDPTVIKIFRNGQKLRLGSSNDYVVSESGGLGTGYDTITINYDPLFDNEVLVADYISA